MIRRRRRAASATRRRRCPPIASARPADIATPVRDSEPPVGSAPKKPPARLAAPCATKSPRRVGPAAVGVGYGRGDARRLSEADQRDGQPAARAARAWRRSSVIRRAAARWGSTRCRRPSRPRCAAARRPDRHHDERDQRRERLERLDEVKDGPHRHGRQRDQTRRGLPRADVGEGFDELANGVVALRSDTRWRR